MILQQSIYTCIYTLRMIGTGENGEVASLPLIIKFLSKN